MKRYFGHVEALSRWARPCSGPVIHKIARHATACSTMHLSKCSPRESCAAMASPHEGRHAGDKIPSLRSVLVQGSFHSSERASNCQFRRHGLTSTLEW